MLIVIAGERCTGKSALARAIMEKIHAEFFAGRDYVRLAPTEPEAVDKFQLLLAEKQHSEDYVIFLLTEPDLYNLVPPGSFVVMCRSRLETSKARFAKQMPDGELSPAIAAMLERQRGSFDRIPHSLTLDTDGADLSLLAVEVLEQCERAGKSESNGNRGG